GLTLSGRSGGRCAGLGRRLDNRLDGFVAVTRAGICDDTPRGLPGQHGRDQAPRVAQTAEGLIPRKDDRCTARLAALGATTPTRLPSRRTGAPPSLQPPSRPRSEISESSGDAVGTSSRGQAMSRTRVEARACTSTFFTAERVTSPVSRPSRSWVGN